MSTSKIKWSEFFNTREVKFLIAAIAICLIMASILGAIIPNLMRELGQSYSNKAEYNQSLLNLLILFVVIYLNRVVY